MSDTFKIDPRTFEEEQERHHGVYDRERKQKKLENKRFREQRDNENCYGLEQED